MHESLPDVAELRSWVPVFVYERKDRILGLSCSRVTDLDLEVVQLSVDLMKEPRTLAYLDSD